MMTPARSLSLSSYCSSDGDPIDYVDDISDECSESVLSSQSASDAVANGTRGAIPRRLRPLNLLPYTPWVMQRLNQCTAPNLTSGQFHKRLQVLDSHLRADSFVYSSPGEFRQGKLLLLRLWKRMLFDDGGRFTIKYGSLLLALAQRYEFDLIHTATSWRRSSEDGDYSALMIGDPLYVEDHAGPGQCLARAYHCILARTAALIFTHESSASLRIMMAAVAFFRLPTLCAPLIDAAADGHDDDRARSNSCSDIRDDLDTFAAAVTAASRARLSDQAQFFKYNPSLFNWVNITQHTLPTPTDTYAFFDQCRRELGFDDEPSALLTAAEPFCVELGRDPDTLHAFIAAVVAHVMDVAHGPVQWTCVPGLWPLLSAAIRSLQSVRPLAYRPRVRRCIAQYLQNPDMLQFVVRACLEATPVHDKFEVNAALDMIESWMATASTAAAAAAPDKDQSGVSSLSAPLPSSFCMKDFLLAIQLLLEQEQFQVLVKVLTFLYSVAGRFTGTHRIALFHDLIVGRLFLRLFLHWSPEVRRRFHYLIVYKFNRGGLSDPPVLPSALPSPYSLTRSRPSSGRATPASSPPNNRSRLAISSAVSSPSSSSSMASSWSLMRSSLSWLSSTLGGSVSSVISSGRQALPLSLSLLTLPSNISRKTSSPATSLTDSVACIQNETRSSRPKRVNTECGCVPESLGIAFASPPLPSFPSSGGVPLPSPYSSDMTLQPHACVLIRTRLDAQSAADDRHLMSLVRDRLDQVRDLELRALRSRHPSAVYAAPSLDQYAAVRTGYERLQRRRALRFGEVLAPELSYEIVDPSLCVMDGPLLSSPPVRSSGTGSQQ